MISGIRKFEFVTNEIPTNEVLEEPTMFIFRFYFGRIVEIFFIRISSYTLNNAKSVLESLLLVPDRKLNKILRCTQRKNWSNQLNGSRKCFYDNVTSKNCSLEKKN